MPIGLCNIPSRFEQLMETVLRGLMSCVLGRRNCDWPHVPRTPAQPVESVPTILRCLPEAQFREVPTLAEGSMIPWAHYVASRR
jgi:hypothetical protein